MSSRNNDNKNVFFVDYCVIIELWSLSLEANGEKFDSQKKQLKKGVAKKIYFHHPFFCSIIFL